MKGLFCWFFQRKIDGLSSKELKIDRADHGLYFGDMKIKTSITLSKEVLKAIER